ncbi:eif3k [Symbiodinium necroappetens]|uniref:Eif3k protein n=1 Tax=Symbiodinium necroappetens TaxID=1628268 RepID=A0A813A132_9DINO|nr:eif3k [Symbiodinium necroappetens]
MHTTAELMSFGRPGSASPLRSEGWRNASRLLGYFDLKPPVGFELEISGTHQALEDITPADPVEVEDMPSSIETALDELQDAREEDDVLRHGHIILPAVQPDNSFATVLALPDWTADWLGLYTCVLIDTRALDGRLFAWIVQTHTTRQHLFDQIGVKDSSGLRRCSLACAVWCPLAPGSVGTHNSDLKEGRVDLKTLSEQYGADAPEGYCVNIKDSQLRHSQDQDSPEPGEEEGSVSQLKLLAEPAPTTTPAETALFAARRIARAYGEAWPFLPAGALPRVPLPGDPYYVGLQTAGGLSLLAAALLTPDAQIEQVEVWLPHPVEVNAACAEIQRYRDALRLFFFPSLIPVWPQPSEKWATFLALPAWAGEGIIICIDARQYDGRVFSCACPLVADRFTILHAAGLLGQPVDVHTPFLAEPVGEEEDLQLQLGLCITIMPRGQPPPPLLDIEVLLNFPLSWRRGPAFPVVPTSAYYCAATEGGHRLFAIGPARSWFYREDLAALLLCPVERLAHVGRAALSLRQLALLVNLPHLLTLYWSTADLFFKVFQLELLFSLSFAGIAKVLKCGVLEVNVFVLAPQAAQTFSNIGCNEAMRLNLLVCSFNVLTLGASLEDSDGSGIGSIQSTQIGEVGQETEDLPGQHWHQILAEMKCFLPCTFAAFQRGETHTYVQKRNKKHCRPDMIGIPISWHTNAVRAWVAAEIHVALATQDHYATCVTVDLEMALPVSAKKGAPKKVTPELICDPHNQSAIKEVPWAVSSHAHAAIVVKHLQDGLGALATTVRSRPHQPYITDSTWQLQRAVTGWKRSLRRLQTQKRLQTVAICLALWRGINAPDNRCEHPLLCGWMTKAIVSEIAHFYHLNILCKLRQACRDDRDSYVGDLARQASEKRSCFILFTDIASAFYSVVRQLVASGGLSSGSALSLEGLHLPPEDIAALLEHAAQPSALAEAGATSWLEAVAHRLTDATWFVLQQDHTPVVTSRGTRPGSSWADILFSFVVKKILHRRDVLMGCNPCQAVRAVSLPCDGSVSLCLQDTDSSISLDDLIWADDIATMRAANTAAGLQPAMQNVAGNTCDAFTEHGFRLSFGRNKTAALAQPAGNGARAVRRSLFGHRGLQGTLQTLRENDVPAQIPLVSVYKHLGAQISVSGKMEDEIAYRIAQARVAFAEGRRKVFKAPGIAIQRKSFILRSFVLPKLLYGSGSWPPLSSREQQRFNGALWAFYRQILCIPAMSDQHFSYATILTLVGLPGPRTVLHVQRLLYLGQLIRHAPSELWALLKLDRPYAALMQESTRWLHGWTHRTTPLPNPDCQWTCWVELMNSSPGKYKGWVLRAQGLECKRCHVAAALDGLYRVLRSYAIPVTVGAQGDHQAAEVCIPCRKTFQSRVAWSCHAQKVHGYRTHAHLRRKTTAVPLCQACGKLYASPGRLQRHLMYSVQCVQRWGSFKPTGKVLQSAHLQAPPEQLAGEQQESSFIDFQPGISEPLLQALLEIDPADEHALWSTVMEHIEPLQTLRDTVSIWSDRVASPTATATAENLLLLLDPELLGETPVQPRERPQCPADVSVDWPTLPAYSIYVSGDRPYLDLAAPPPVSLPPLGSTSITLRQATEYACWLEQACVCIAKCLAGGSEAAPCIQCVGLEAGLGPAAGWLRAGGATFTASGLSFRRS